MALRVSSVTETDSSSSSNSTSKEHSQSQSRSDSTSTTKKLLDNDLMNQILSGLMGNMTDEEIRNIGKIYIIACGSSYHVGVVGKYNLERMLRRSVEVCLASEFRYSDPIVGKGDLVIVISQSGETLDTMAAMREAKKRGAHILSIVNVVGSSIARESDTVLYTWAGPEIAVATTKAYSTQMAVLNLLGLYFSQVLGTLDHATYSAMVRGMEKLPEQMAQILRGLRLRRAQARHHLPH